MSRCRDTGSSRVWSWVLLLGLAVVLVSATALAQEEPTPKVDVFVGYQWLNPGGTVPVSNVLPFLGPQPPVATKLPDMPSGWGSTLTYNFDSHWGLSLDVGGNYQRDANESTISVGPRFMWRIEGLNLFAHTLLGLNRLAPRAVNASNGLGAILGGGIDVKVWRPLSIRLIEADYAWGNHNFTDAVSAISDARRPKLNGARLRGGLVLNFGYPSEVTPTASCSVQPSEVMVGEPVTATATGSNFNPKHTLTYTWSGNGGKVTSKEGTATMDTNGVAGASYTLTAHITDPKMKKGGVASCSANFTVKELPKHPPTMSCSADPTSVQSGASSNISCTCNSPDNASVTVSGWTASAGSVSGSGNAATLSTTGAPAGPITVSATCTDSRGLTASASTQITVEVPPPPKVNQLEVRLALHSVYFPTAQPTVQKPTGGLLASQQQTLIVLAGDFLKYLETKPDAHLILEGHADARGSVAYNQALSERRVERTKGFLVERGVPAANIETKALGNQHNLTADEVKVQVETNPELTPEERQRILKNTKTIIWASNRRVDITLNTTGQESVRHLPFNAADSLSLIGGREVPKKAAPGTKKAAPAPKKGAKKKQ
jgi:outer membrane protein OmpA-like peptidoglycan-associated protein